MDNGSLVQKIIAQVLGIDPDMVKPTLAAGDIPQWDSMGNMAIIARIEEEAGIEIPMEDLFELTSVASIVAELDKLGKA